MNQVARVFQRPVGANPDASHMTAAAMCPEAPAGSMVPLNRRHGSNQQAEFAATCQSEKLSLGSAESVCMLTGDGGGGGDGNTHCYRNWPPTLVNSAVSFEPLHLNPYLGQDRASCLVVCELDRPANIFDKRHVQQTPRNQLQDAAHAQAFELSELADRLDPYRARSLPVEAAAVEMDLHENGFNNNNRLQQQQQQQQQQLDCLPLNYEWPPDARLRGQDSSPTSSWHPRLDQFSAEQALRQFNAMTPPHRKSIQNSNIATSDQLDGQCLQTFDQRPRLVPFDTSPGVTLSRLQDIAGSDCVCLECCQRRQHFQLTTSQIASLEDNKNEFCRHPSPIGRLSPTSAHEILANTQLEISSQNWRTHSTLSIPDDLVNGFDTTIRQQHHQQPIHQHQLANSGHFYTASPELGPFELDPTGELNNIGTISPPALVMNHIGQSHFGAPPLDNLPVISKQRLAAAMQPPRPSLIQQPSNSKAQFPFQPQNQQQAPSSVPSSPLVVVATGQMGPHYYGRHHGRSIVQTAQVQPSHLSRWPAQKPRPPLSNNNDLELVQNCRIGPEEYLASGGCKSTAAVDEPSNCQIKLPFDGGQPADWEIASWHADQAGNRRFLDDDDGEGEEEEEYDDEEAETLALVPSQAKGRLPMSVAEQMSEQASKFVQNHPSGASSPGPHSSRRQSMRSPTGAGHRLAPNESSALNKQQLAGQRRHRQQRHQSTPSTRSRSLAAVGAPSDQQSNWTCGGEQESANSLQEKGAAYQCGKLRASDLILEVNGVSTVNMTHDEIAETIANAYYQDERPYIEFLIGESVRA